MEMIVYIALKKKIIERSKLSSENMKIVVKKAQYIKLNHDKNEKKNKAKTGFYS